MFRMRLFSQIVLLFTMVFQSHLSGGALQKVTATMSSNDSHQLPQETPSVLPDTITSSLQMKPGNQGLVKAPFNSTLCSTVDYSSKEETTAEVSLNNRDACRGSEKTGSATVTPGGFMAIILCIVLFVTAMHFKVVNRLREITCAQALATHARSVVLSVRRVTQKVLPGIFGSPRHQEQGLYDRPTQLSEVKLALPLLESEVAELYRPRDVS